MRHYKNFSLFAYGQIVRKKRKALGLEKAKELSKLIAETTGVDVSTDTIYKIEQGCVGLHVDKFIAINETLFGSAFPEKELRICTNKDIIESEEIWESLFSS